MVLSLLLLLLVTVEIEVAIPPPLPILKELEVVTGALFSCNNKVVCLQFNTWWSIYALASIPGCWFKGSVNILWVSFEMDFFWRLRTESSLWAGWLVSTKIGWEQASFETSGNVHYLSTYYFLSVVLWPSFHPIQLGVFSLSFLVKVTHLTF